MRKCLKVTDAIFLICEKLEVLSHSIRKFHPVPTDSYLALSHFFESADLEPANVPDLLQALATGHWESTPQWHFPFWPLLTVDHNLDANVDNIASQVLLSQPGTNDQQEIREVVLTLLTSPDLTLEVAEPSVYWDGPGTPIAVRMHEGSIVLDPFSPAFSAELLAAIELISARRHARFLVCPECGESNPPEHRMGDALCHGCAQENHGVIF